MAKFEIRYFVDSDLIEEISRVELIEASSFVEAVQRARQVVAKKRENDFFSSFGILGIRMIED